MAQNLLQYAAYLLVLFLLAWPLGTYIAKSMLGEKTFLTKVISPLERGTYKLLHIDPEEEMTWKKYLAAVLAFSVFSLVFLWLLLMFQGYLPGNPNGLQGQTWDLAFNTAASFVTNTNWQAYSGETSLTWLSQTLGLTVQNFVTPAVGLAVMFALIRGFVRTKDEGIGSFWTDMVRGLYYVLLPLSIVVALVLVAGGVPQNYSANSTVNTVESVDVAVATSPIAFDGEGNFLGEVDASTVDSDSPKLADGTEVPSDGTVYAAGAYVADASVEDGKIVDASGATVDGAETYAADQQVVPQFPAASQIAIKQLGTNGGGVYGVNSAFPLENPNALTNLFECTSLLLIPVACCFAFGYAVKDKKQGYAICAAMGIMLVAFLAIIAINEQNGTPQLAQNGAVDLGTIGQAGGNMEGKESRFGIVSSSVWANYTTAASNGSVNSMHDSYTPIGGLVTMLQMQLGEVIYGGVGCGLYGMIGFCILTVFVCGLMVGRTPEFLGKKIEPFEMKWAVVVCLATPVAILVGSGLACMDPATVDSLNNPGAHGLSEILYAYSSGGGNNGSAFAGFNANTPFLNVSIGLVMIFVRFVPITAICSIAGSLSRKRMVAKTAGTLTTNGPLFVFLLIFFVLLVGALSFFPALSLGPIAEFFGMFGAGVY